MDKIYLQNLIEKIEYEKLVHPQKFTGNPIHENCLGRFEMTLQKLRDELAKLETSESKNL